MPMCSYKVPRLSFATEKQKKTLYVCSCEQDFLDQGMVGWAALRVLFGYVSGGGEKKKVTHKVDGIS